MIDWKKTQLRFLGGLGASIVLEFDFKSVGSLQGGWGLLALLFGGGRDFLGALLLGVLFLALRLEDRVALVVDYLGFLFLAVEVLVDSVDRVADFPGVEVVGVLESELDDSSVLEHGVVLLDFAVGLEVGVDLFAAELEGHDSEDLSHVIGFVSLDLVREERAELLDGDDFVLFGFDLLDEFFEQAGGAEELDSEVLVVLEVTEDGLGVVFGDVFGVLVGLVDSLSFSLGVLSLVRVAVSLLVVSVGGLVLGVLGVADLGVVLLDSWLGVVLVDVVIGAVTDVVGAHLGDVVVAVVEVWVDVVVGAGSDEGLGVRVLNFHGWHVVVVVVLGCLGLGNIGGVLGVAVGGGISKVVELGLLVHVPVLVVVAIIAVHRGEIVHLWE